MCPYCAEIFDRMGRTSTSSDELQLIPGKISGCPLPPHHVNNVPNEQVYRNTYRLPKQHTEYITRVASLFVHRDHPLLGQYLASVTSVPSPSEHWHVTSSCVVSYAADNFQNSTILRYKYRGAFSFLLSDSFARLTACHHLCRDCEKQRTQTNKPTNSRLKFRILP
jgi:hypothetical protein